MRQLHLPNNHCMLTIADGSLAERNALLQTLITFVSDHYSRLALITDARVAALHGKFITSLFNQARLECCLITLPPGETSKTLLGAHRCWTEMLSNHMDRESLVIAFGGGVVTDLAGFSAACFMRGIDVVHIPTTLLGMVDAAIGGKTGINLPEGKNLVGRFHHPKQILIFPLFLQTLPEREYKSGLAEVIKYGVICDPSLFEYLEQEMPSVLKRTSEALSRIILKSCEAKIQVVNDDAEDITGLRAILNWGHTFAHAIESITQYRAYRHGEAVAIGMCMAAQVSEHLGFATRGFSRRQKQLVQRAGLPDHAPALCSSQLIQAMKRDKKSISGKIHLILAEKIGKVFSAKDVDPKSIREALSTKD